MTISLELSDKKFKIAAFLELVGVVQKIGIPINLSGESDTRRDALAFTVECIQNMYADTNWRMLLQDLINKVGKFNDPADASWFLEREIEALFKAHAIELMTEAQENQRMQIEGIANLFAACKKKNLEQHKKGETVHFGGIPRDLLPEWYLDRLWTT